MILDTGALSALVAGDRALEPILGGSTRHHLPAIVLGEYRFGLIRSKFRTSLGTLLEEIEAHSEVLVVDSATARAYAALRDRLQSRGRPIPENDIWIAALAVQHHLPVVSCDRHFDSVEGLKRVEW